MNKQKPGCDMHHVLVIRNASSPITRMSCINSWSLNKSDSEGHMPEIFFSSDGWPKNFTHVARLIDIFLILKQVTAARKFYMEMGQRVNDK